MGRDHLDQLADEAASRFPPAADPPPADAAAPADHPADPGAAAPIDTRAALKSACTKGIAGAVAVLANGPVVKFQLDPLRADEATLLSGAMVDLLEVYGLLDVQDPRVAAWLNLGVAAIAIALPRVAQWTQRPREKDPDVAAGETAAQTAGESETV